MRVAVASFLALLPIAAACSESSTQPRVAGLPAEALTAPVSSQVGAQSLAIETYLWRDFQPVAPPNGHPLIAVVRVRTTAGGPVAPTVAVDSIWVLSGSELWAARAVQEYQSNPLDGYLEVVAREGPKWGPGVFVDVVARVRDGSGAPVYLRARNQPIHRTD